MFKYALFDLDMTLIDSIVPLMTSANLLADEYSLRKVSYEEVYQAEVSVPNCTFESLWQDLWGRYDPAWYETYRDKIADKEYEVMELFPSGLDTLKSLKNKNIPIGLASNRDYPRRALKCMDIEDYFKVVIGTFDVERPKPAPDVIIKAMEQMGAPADELLYICDSLGDLRAAEAAGVKCFSMTTGGHNAEELKAKGAFATGDKLIEIVDLFR